MKSPMSVILQVVLTCHVLSLLVSLAINNGARYGWT